MSDRFSQPQSGWRRWQPQPLDAYQELATETSAGASDSAPPAAGAEAPVEPSVSTSALTAARAEAREEALREGYEQGFSDGQAKAIEEAEAAADKALEEQRAELAAPLQALSRQLPAAWHAVGDEFLHELSELAVQVGEQLAQDQLERHPKQVTRLIGKLLQAEPMVNEQPRLWLHPDDLKLVREAMGETLTEYGWQLLADDQLTRGGCLVRSQQRELDARWETRRRQIQELLHENPPTREGESD